MSTSGSSSAMGGQSSKSAFHPVDSAANSEQADRVPEDVDNLRKLCQQFNTLCANPLCHAVIKADDKVNHIDAWRDGALTIPPTSHLSAFACKCGVTICVGCKKAPTLNTLNLFTPLGVVNHCCEQGRLFTIYFLLARFDDTQLQPANDLQPKVKPKKKAPKSAGNGKASSSSGTGYASGYDVVAYGGPPSWAGLTVDEIDAMEYPDIDFPGIPFQYSTIMPRALVQPDDDDKKEKDALMIETLQLLRACLPDINSSAVDESNLFRLCMFFDRITDLIRNDSITDVTDRTELYMEVIKFVKAVADIPALASLLFEQRPEKSRSPGLRRLGNLTCDDPSVPFISLESHSASVYDCSKNIYQQAKIFLKLAAKRALNGGSSQTPVNPLKKETTKLCEGILDLHDHLRLKAELADARPPLAQLPRADSNLHGDALWAKYQQENRVTFSDEVLTAHRFTNEMNNMQTSVAKNRLNTISKEVATLTTSLPDGIFLKIAESRFDVMKVMIIGSEGSPYAGGLFIFDLFLPAEYPLVPPKMGFVLNGNDGDTYSFNPNLHVGGGICLSILNTWSGMPQEMWQPGKSTILAVLVSIQAMILGAPFPWHNEPGHENEGESNQVKENKKVVQAKTIRYAMLAWIENKFEHPNTKEHIWKEVSQTYWAYNGEKVLATVNTWVADNPQLLEFSPNLPFPFGSRKGRGKTSAQVSEPTVNLINKLAESLGLELPYPEPESGEKKGLMSKLNGMRGKRKGESAMGGNIAHHPKKQKSESSGSFEQKWVYTGGNTQKEARAACKEFGIGAAPSVKGTIAKLEKHVNEKGKATPALMERWGKLIFVEEPDLEASSAGSSWPGSLISDDDEFALKKSKTQSSLNSTSTNAL